jgi:hypothetical protein
MLQMVNERTQEQQNKNLDIHTLLMAERIIYLYSTQKYFKKPFTLIKKRIITACRIIKQLECNESTEDEEYIQNCEETSYLTAISKTEKQLENNTEGSTEVGCEDGRQMELPQDGV